MKHHTSVHCNLCQKSFINYQDYSNHLSNNHLPQLNLTCALCENQQTSLQELQLHLNSAHKSQNTDFWDVFQFGDIFANISDVRLHTKQCAEWIEQSFSFGLESTLSRKEIRTIIKSSYSHDFNEFNSDCELCDDTISRSYCGYCGQQFSRKCHLKVHILRSHISLSYDLKKNTNICEVCRKPFRTRKILIQHSICEHSTKMTKVARRPHFCNFCNKKLANKSNLNRHLVNQHSEEIGATVNTFMFTCEHCKCVFSNKSSLKRHIENLHLKMTDTKTNISCFQCGHRFNSIRNLNAHLTIEHNITINEEKLQFNDMSEFFTWKKEEEIRTNSRFIQLRGLRKQRRKGEQISTLKFVCHRSGIFRSKANGKRAYRVKGSSKIGRYCSSYIEIRFKENDLVNGNYCSTHAGHDNDLRYLNLTMDEKREIYEKIKSGASFTSILNEIRNTVGKEIKRKHLLTNKDLHNIVKTFKRAPMPNQDETFAQSSSCRPQPGAEQSLEQHNRNFNTDQDVCCDLWVETCQRMVNRFDQNDPGGNISCKDPNPRNVSLADEVVQQNPRNRASAISLVNNHDYCVNSVPNIPHQSNYRTQNYSSYENQTAVSAISDHLRLNKDFYPIDIVNVDAGVPNSTKTSSTCSVGYITINSNDQAHASPAYFKNTNVYDKLPNNANVTPSQHTYDSYTYADKLPSTSNLDDNNDNFDEIISDESGDDESPTHSEDKSKQDVPDLRDRVNSVTALYNIVESELDDRKKDIIRNYVDNMFRVLQYRYNKHKTKTKPRSENQATSKEKKSKNQLQSTNKKYKKNRVPDHSSAPFTTSSEYVPKAPDTTYMSTNSLDNSAIGSLNGRTETEFMRWDRY